MQPTARGAFKLRDEIGRAERAAGAFGVTQCGKQRQVGLRLDQVGEASDPLDQRRDPHHAVQVVQYVARVVDPGRYAWEPAVLQSSIVADQGVATPAGTLEIGGAGG